MTNADRTWITVIVVMIMIAGFLIAPTVTSITQSVAAIFVIGVLYLVVIHVNSYYLRDPR